MVMALLMFGKLALLVVDGHPWMGTTTRLTTATPIDEEMHVASSISFFSLGIGLVAVGLCALSLVCCVRADLLSMRFEVGTYVDSGALTI